MKLLETNGLYKVIKNASGENLDVYYNKDKFEVVIYYINATKEQIDKLKLFITDYIGRHCLYRTYEKITIYN